MAYGTGRGYTIARRKSRGEIVQLKIYAFMVVDMTPFIALTTAYVLELLDGAHFLEFIPACR